jgi:excisionase family DNA binding protein
MNKRYTINTDVRPSQVLPPRGLRILQAADYMGTTPFFVADLIRPGELPALKLGQRYVVLREDADKFLDRKRRDLENERKDRYDYEAEPR